MSRGFHPLVFCGARVDVVIKGGGGGDVITRHTKVRNFMASRAAPT